MQENVSFIFAFFAGVASFLSPCVLPLIPAYLGYLVGTSAEKTAGERWLLFTRSFGFIIGFTIIFVALGTTASFIGSFLIKYQDVIRRIGGILVILLGLYLTGLLPINFLSREKRTGFLPKMRGFVPSILMGMAFATGWTPCIGPILASILIYAGTSQTVWKGALLLAVYSLGLGVPFLITALLLEYFIKFQSRFNKMLPWISRIGGILLLIMGILLYFNRLTLLSF